MAYATTADFEKRHGDLDSDQETVVEALLDDASGLIASEVEGSEQEWVTAGSAPAAVVAVTVAVAYRAWSNPDGLARAGVADVSVGWRATAAEAMFITPSESKRVRRAAKSSSYRSATMVTPYSGDEEDELDEILA
jgi:hypothetical protein